MHETDRTIESIISTRCQSIREDTKAIDLIPQDAEANRSSGRYDDWAIEGFDEEPTPTDARDVNIIPNVWNDENENCSEHNDQLFDLDL